MSAGRLAKEKNFLFSPEDGAAAEAMSDEPEVSGADQLRERQDKANVRVLRGAYSLVFSMLTTSMKPAGYLLSVRALLSTLMARCIRMYLTSL